MASLVLSGTFVRLEPLTLDHITELSGFALDPDLWKWVPTRMETRADLEGYVREALMLRDQGAAIPFVHRELATGKLAGSTRFGNIERKHRRLEIGWTWLGKPWQRTALNTEAKLLMLTHAFTAMECQRVELKTDERNEKSRAAIQRIGAQFEGIFRKHMVCPSGRIRNTAWYSITDEEWPKVRSALEDRLQVASRTGRE